MTNNQLQYLRNEETKRNNLITESQRGTELDELKRHNLVLEKETNRTNKANEKINRTRNKNTLKAAKTSAAAQKYSARLNSSASKYSAETSASASRYAADKSYQASTYSTDVNAAVKAADRAQNAANQAAKLQNDADIAKLQSATSRFSKKIDVLLKSKELSQREKESLRRYKTEMDKLSRTLAHDSSERALDRLFNSLGKAQDFVKDIAKKIK